MLAPRTAAPSPQPGAQPDSIPAEERSSLRAASGQEAPIPSPVHALQAELAEGLEPVSRRFDPGKAIIVATLAVYTAAFWWGVASVGSTWLRHFSHH